MDSLRPDRFKYVAQSAFKNLSQISEEVRRLFVWILIGANRTGKTVTEIEMIKAWKRANPRGRVIAHDPQGFIEQAGLADVLIKTHIKDWAKILCKKTGVHGGMGGAKEFKFGDCLLVLDDFRTLHPQHQMQQDMIALLGQRTKMNLDIILSVWSPINILDQLAGFINRYSIFYTNAQQGGFSDKIPNYVPCQKASFMINEYVKAYDLLNKGRELYPNFPYILVRDDNDQMVETVNIDTKSLLKVLGKN